MASVSSLSSAQADVRWASTLAQPRLLTMLQQQTPDTVLAFDEQRGLPVIGLVLKLSSQPLADMLDVAGDAPRVLRVAGDDPKGWLCTLEQLYPTYHAPLTWSGVAAMLPVIHKYDFTKLLDGCRAWLQAGEQEFSASKDSDAFVMRWLVLGDTLQLDFLPAKAEAFLRSEIAAGRTGMLVGRNSRATLQGSTLVTLVTQLAAAVQRSKTRYGWQKAGDDYVCSGRDSSDVKTSCRLLSFGVQSSEEETPDDYMLCPMCKGLAEHKTTY